MLSKYCSSIANKYDITIGSINKLVPNLGNKSKYVLHYKLVNVYRILRFKNSDWLNNYIDFNTDKTKKCCQ